MPRSTRTLIAIILWIAATFMVINHIISAAPLGDWWLALLLVIVGLLIWFYPEGTAATRAEMDAYDSGQMNTEKRMDALAASASTGDARLQDPVANISTDPSATLEETGELSGPPGAPVSHDEPVSAPARTPVSTPAPAPTPTPAPVQSAADVDADEEVMTEERSDAIAAEVDASDAQADAVENINTDPTATLEETGEISGPPSASVDHEQAEPESSPGLTESEAVKDEIEKEFVEHSHVTAEGEIVGTVNITGNRESVTLKDDPRVDPEVVGITEVDESRESTTVEEKEATEEQAHTDAPDDPTVGEDDHEVPSEPEIDPQPAPPEDRVPDDLKRVEGIGPKMSRALIAAGIDTFTKLSNASEEEIRAAIDAAGMRLAPSVPTWAKQADFAARGDWEGLAAYQSTLSSGREVTE